MDIGRITTLYLRALAPWLLGSEMAFSLTFRQPYDTGRLLASFEALVRRHTVLRSRFAHQEGDSGWTPLSSAEVEAALNTQRQQFGRAWTLDEVQSTPGPDGSLPIRLFLVDDRRLILRMSHMLANGSRALAWIESWLSIDEREPSAPPPPATRADSSAPSRPSVAQWIVLLAFAVQFRVRAGWRPARTTVDLTHGRAPVPHRAGYAVRTYTCSVDETRTILDRNQALGLSLTQATCAAMAAAMFAEQPAKSRVCISVPSNLERMAPGSFQESPGDYTGHLIVQVRRGRSLDLQVREAFKWLHRGIDALLPLAVSALAGSEQALYERFEATASRPVPQRAPFQNLSCTVSTLGRIRLPTLCRELETVSACTQTQGLSVSLTTIEDRLSIEVIVARDLYDPHEVFRVTDDAVGRLLGGQAGCITI